MIDSSKFWFKHPVNSSVENVFLRRVIDDFGLAGYGMYWMMEEDIERNGGVSLMSRWIRNSHRGLKAKDIQLMASSEYGLFATSQLGVITRLTNDLFSRDACASDGGASGGASDRTSDRTSAGVCACHSSINKKEEREGVPEAPLPLPGEEKVKTKEEEEADYLKRMWAEFPTVMSLSRPLTLAESDRLVRDFGQETVWDVLEAMENTKNLCRKYNSANLTARKWCKTQRK